MEVDSDPGSIPEESTPSSSSFNSPEPGTSQQRIEEFSPEYILPTFIEKRLNSLFELENPTFLLSCIENSAPFLANCILLKEFEKINYKFCFLVDSKKNGEV